MLPALPVARFDRNDKPGRTCRKMTLPKATAGSARAGPWIQPDVPSRPTPRALSAPHGKAAGSFLPAAFYIQSDLVPNFNQLGSDGAGPFSGGTEGAVPSTGVSVTVESGAGMTAPSGCVGSKAPAPGRSGAIGGASGIGRGVPT